MFEDHIFDELIVLQEISNASNKALDLIYRRVDIEFRRLREQNGVKIDAETMESVKFGFCSHLSKREFVDMLLM